MPSLFGLEEDDEEQPETPETETDPDEGAEDDLSDVDPELRARFERVAAARVGGVEGRLNVVREKARARGMAITDDGDLALLDRERLSGWLPAPTPAAAAVTPTPAAAATEEDDDIPDPSMDAAGFRKWFGAQQQKAIAEATKPLLDALTQTRHAVASREAEQATRRAAEVVEDYGLGEIARHPAFAEQFQKTLLQIDGDWRDDEVLARVAFMIIPDLKKIPAGSGKKFAQAGADGRFVKNRDYGRAATNRGLLEQAAPSRGASRGPASTTYDDIDKITAERLGCSLEEARALKDPTGNAYTAIQAKKAGAARGRR